MQRTKIYYVIRDEIIRWEKECSNRHFEDPLWPYNGEDMVTKSSLMVRRDNYSSPAQALRSFRNVALGVATHVLSSALCTVHRYATYTYMQHVRTRGTESLRLANGYPFSLRTRSHATNYPLRSRNRNESVQRLIMLSTRQNFHR